MNWKQILIFIISIFIIFFIVYLIIPGNYFISKITETYPEKEYYNAANTPADSQGLYDNLENVESESPQMNIRPDTTVPGILSSDNGSNKIPDSELEEKAKAGWDLIWNDEFNDKSINNEYWTLQKGENVWGNNELQYYTNRADNCCIEDGKLIIRGLQETYGNSNYTSARIITKNKICFLYGKIEIKAKFPKGKGLCPAIWLLPCEDTYHDSVKNGEIDMVEMLGNDPKKIYGVAHYSYKNKKRSYKKYSDGVTDYSEGFHVYSIEWDSQEIKWMVDDKVYFTFHFSDTFNKDYDPFNRCFYLIINLAIGGNWPGYDLSKTEFPSSIEVDYVRYYKLKQTE